MIPSSVDFDLLRAFLLVGRVGNMSRAAESSGRTQSALSMQMKRLEDLMGRQLLRRTGRGVVPTSDGELLLGYASRILALGDEVVSRLRQPALSGTVRIGLPEEVTLTTLPVALGKFRRAHPDVSLEVLVDTTAAIEPLWREGGLDIMIATPSGVHEDADRCWSMELHWVGAAGYRPLPGEPLDIVTFAQPCTWRKRLFDALTDAGLDYRVSFTSPSMAAVQAAVAAGLGVTLLTHECTRPQDMARVASQLSLPDPVIVQYGLYTRRKKSPAVECVAAALLMGLGISDMS